VDDGMTDLGAGLFTEGAHTGPAWELIRQQMVPSERASLEDLREELAVRDAATRYYYAWDQGDLDATLAMFTDDCVLTTAHETVQGRAAAREHYVERIRAAPHRFHYITNQVVRLSADRREALVTSYHHAFLDSVSGPAKAVGGVTADQMVKTDSGWKIAARTASIDFSFELRPSG
jgi:uncharacterized protein (TIGR02246 family)